ncbi:MAG: GNAT family N-acetyltransferase [Leptothrix sp. (in: b-proteobacteria)]
MMELPLPTLPFADLAPWPRRQPVAMPVFAPVVPARKPSRRDADRPALEVTWARDEADVRAAQRLRYQVFAEEMGARLTTPPGTPAGYDVDVFDPYCEHLLVRSTGDEPQVIGTYRVLTPQAAKRVGGWYSDTEFDLTRLRPLQGRMAELGRSCVHPDHRSGAVIMALWGALASFMTRNGLDTMVGCASIAMHDGGHVAASLWEQLRQTHLAPIEHQVQPRLALPVDDLQRDLPVEAPPLIKGYLRCGAKVLGPPAWDPDFNTADLPIMLRLRDLPEKYRRHFLETA